MGLVLVSCSELAFEGSGVNAEAIAWPWVWVWATSCNICKHCKLRDASSIWSKFWRLTWKTQPLFDFGSVHLCTSLYISALGSSWKFPSVFFRFLIRFLWLWASDLTQMGYNSPIQCLSPISPSHPTHPTHPTHTSHSVETWNSDWDFFAMSYPFLSFPIISVSNLSPICLKTTRAEEHDEGWFLRWFFLRGDKPSFLREKLQLALEPHATSTDVSRHSKPNQTQVAPPKPNHETTRITRFAGRFWGENETILRFARHLFGPGQAWKGREEREGSSALSVCGYILKFLYDTIWLNNRLYY